MSSPSQQERILNLLALLLHADKPVPFHVIYAQLEGYSDLGMDSARRSFTRDIHTMRELGVPIFYVEHQDVDSGGYEIPKDYYYLPRIDLTEPEKAIVSQISWMTEKSMKSPLFRALYKLNYDSPFENEFAPKISAAAEHDDPVISKLSSFIAHGKTIQFDYQTVASDQESGRVIDPYGLGYYQNHWYLVGFCHRRKAIRCFKVARILGGRFQTYNKRVERDFQIPKEFKIQDYIGGFTQEKTREEFSVTLYFDARIAWMIPEQFPSYPTQILEDESLLLTLDKLTDPKVVFRLIAPYFALARIFSPDWLKEDYRKLVRETIHAQDLRSSKP